MAQKSSARPAKKPVRGDVARHKTSKATRVIGSPGGGAGRPGKTPNAEVDVIDLVEVGIGPTTKRQPRAKRPPSEASALINTAVSHAPTFSAADRPNDVSANLPLTERVVKVIERELGLIEKIVRNSRLTSQQGIEAERRTRMLAVLARTLTELKKARAGDEHRSNHDDDRPHDLDELRRRLSERLAKRLGGGTIVPAGGNAAGRTRLP